MPTIRFLSKADVQKALTMPEAVRLMHGAFAMLSSGRVDAPVRINMEIPEQGARALFMPVYSPAHGQVGLKVVVVSPHNPDHGLPFLHALVLVHDANTGQPLAVMDGAYLTAVRTGAGSGCATGLLARPEAAVAAIFGAGVQARTQLEAVCVVRPIEKVYVFGRSRKNAEDFAGDAAASLNLDVELATNPALLREADIICTATTSLAPVFDHAHVKPGAHINAIGSYRPDMTEIPRETVQAAKVIVDQRKACLLEAGDLMAPIRNGDISEDHIYAELGEIAAGSIPGRTSSDEITLFKSVGNAVQDLVAASHVISVAKKHNYGVEVDL